MDGNVPTLTFYGTTYSSPYLTFTPVEVYTNKLIRQRLRDAAGADPSAVRPLADTSAAGRFPSSTSGASGRWPAAQYSYGPLENLPFSAIAAQVGNNSTVIGADIDASAGQLIKTICASLTHGQPANVCSAANNG